MAISSLTFASFGRDHNPQPPVSSTTFSPLHLVPEGRAMLACSCLVPDGWVQVPVPEEQYDFDNPTVFLPLIVCMAPYGAVVFTIAARPAFGDGSVQDWAEYLAGQNNLQIERIREARVNRMPCILVDATMPSDAGPMRSRSVFLEDGGRLFNIGTLAPDAIWASVEADFDRLLGAFTLDEVRGITAVPLRLMTSESALDLSAPVAPEPAREAAPAPPPVESPATDDEPNEIDAWVENLYGEERATQAVDVALADDEASLDPDNEINARLRDNGIGLVPRVISVVTRSKFAAVGAAAIDSVFRVPFGWHVLDDGKRTLVFDPGGSVQINLDLRPAAADAHEALLERIASELARDNPHAQFLKLELMGLPCIAARDLEIDGERLDQAYLARASTHDGLALVCRVTADRDNMTRAMNTAEVILTSLHGPVPPDPEFAGQPEWWRTAVLHEREDRLDDAEQAILKAVDHIGAYSSVAHMYEERSARLARAGRTEDAEAARAQAIRWLHAYAGSATSGGEGAALSRERDQRIEALGGEDARPD